MLRNPCVRSCGLIITGLVHPCVHRSHLYPTDAAPYYRLGYGLTFSCQLTASVLALVLTGIWHTENQRRDRKYGKPHPREDIDTGTYGDLAPNFRYMT